MSRRTIVPEGSTPPFGAYSHAVAVELGDSEIIFVTGQIALDDEGRLISDEIEVQARAVFEKIEHILKTSGFTMDDVAKAQIFLTDVADFDVVTPIRNEFFRNSKPASTLVEVPALVREGCKVEVEVTAIRKL